MEVNGHWDLDKTFKKKLSKATRNEIKTDISKIFAYWLLVYEREQVKTSEDAWEYAYVYFNDKDVASRIRAFYRSIKTTLISDGLFSE